MEKINPDLERQLKDGASRTFQLIVRTTGNATPHLSWISAAGLEVKQVFRLSPGVAVSGTGQSALKLLTQSWVVSIELDAPIKAMS